MGTDCSAYASPSPSVRGGGRALDRYMYKATAAGLAEITPQSSKRSTSTKTEIPGLPRRMSSHRAGTKCQAARRMPPPLCLLLLLLLLLLGATAALPLEGGLTGHDSGVSSPCLGRMLAHFLAVSLSGRFGHACGLPSIRTAEGV